MISEHPRTSRIIEAFVVDLKRVMIASHAVLGLYLEQTKLYVHCVIGNVQQTEPRNSCSDEQIFNLGYYHKRYSRGTTD